MYLVSSVQNREHKFLIFGNLNLVLDTSSFSRVGTNFNDLQEIEVVELQEPTGWVEIPLKHINDKLVRTFLLQIAVIQNHQQGRDTHLRQVKVFSPVVTRTVSSAEFASFTSQEIKQHMFLR